MKIDAFDILFVGFLVMLTLAAIYGVIDNADKASDPNYVPASVTIEGHDYFKIPQYNSYFSLTHKGNCKSCAGEKVD